MTLHVPECIVRIPFEHTGQDDICKPGGVVFVFIVALMTSSGEMFYNPCPFDDSFHRYPCARSIACILFAL